MSNENTSCFTYKVEMIIQILAADEISARAQLDEKGGYVTSREVTFMDSMQVYKGNKLSKKDKKNSDPVVEQKLLYNWSMSPEKISIKKQKEYLARYLKDIKEKNPCMDCKVSYPYYMMDFDHVRGIKHANVAELINTLSKKRLDEEIAKCEVVCSNCHRARTYLRKIKKAGQNELLYILR